MIDARDLVERAVNGTARGPGNELRRMIACLDEDFLRRTLRDPNARHVSAWHSRARWRQRIDR
ncbi:hypothetical protein [Alloactinosynnema sp. L-07]|uniref:hypothetical protein n=1 Tax=Alloactinosynnema sp. L-07 TaxID=1653480 RepID=UPI00065F0540|nr:hypothetical protein [Alloactinosynnema sp. L-07]CRK61218.1 hypothetical protein [Alloactinosynnema sp. L-07]